MPAAASASAAAVAQHLALRRRSRRVDPAGVAGAGPPRPGRPGRPSTCSRAPSRPTSTHLVRDADVRGVEHVHRLVAITESERQARRCHEVSVPSRSASTTGRAPTPPQARHWRRPEPSANAAAAKTRSVRRPRSRRGRRVLVDEAGVQVARRRRPACSSSRSRNGMLVRMPSTGNARSAARSRAIAAGRVSADADQLGQQRIVVDGDGRRLPRRRSRRGCRAPAGSR